MAAKRPSWTETEAIRVFLRRNADAWERFLDERRRDAVRIAKHHHIEPVVLLAKLRDPCMACGRPPDPRS